MSEGRLVTVRNIDTVRIEVLGGSRAVSIPAEVILGIDDVLRHCTTGVVYLTVEPVEDDEKGTEVWEASLDDKVIGHGDTAWGAMVSLANAIEAERGRR